MARNRMRAALSIATLMLLTATAVLGGAAPVLAHARYKSSSPEKGAVVPISPSQVEIIFTNDIQKIAGTYDIQVNKDRGPSVTDGPTLLDDADRSKVTVALQPGLPPGRYVVNWKNLSDEDGDPAEGAFSFYIGEYTPTTVDLANDAQLEQIGAEDEGTPTTDATPVGDETRPVGPTAPVKTSGASSPTPSSDDTEADESGNNNLIWIVAVAVGAGLVAAVAGYTVMRRRS